jgi:glycosyltransferase involved in cell wall biosynthesis
MISLIYLTNRQDCKLKWTIQSFANQYDGSIPVEWVIVDFWQKEPGRKEYIEKCIGGSFRYQHISPKPSPVQGEYRVTKENWFAASNARNTGCIYAKGDYMAFVDDLSCLGDNWWKAVKKGCVNNQIIAGCYAKVAGLNVEYGKRISGENRDIGLDARLKHNPHSRFISGGELFGCSFALPVEAYCSVNGMDELLDTLGMEDYTFGIQLQKKGYKIWFDTDMYSEENEEMHGGGLVFKREDKFLSPEQYEATRQKLGCTVYYQPGGRTDSSHLFLDLLYSQKEAWSFGNNFNLAELRKTKQFPMPTGDECHWVDGQPLKDM